VKARLSSGLADCRSPDAGHGRYEAPTTSRKQRRKNFERGVTSDGALESQTETKFLAGRMVLPKPRSLRPKRAPEIHQLQQSIPDLTTLST